MAVTLYIRLTYFLQSDLCTEAMFEQYYTAPQRAMGCQLTGNVFV